MDKKEYKKIENAKRKLKYKRVELPIPHPEYNQFDRIAKKEGRSTNQVILDMAVAYRDSKYFIPHEVITRLDKLTMQLRSIGTNINEISHSSHIFGQADTQAILTHLGELDQSVADFVKGKIGK